MKIYEYHQSQFLPISVGVAWDFFSSPVNLKEITPDYLGFEITSDLGNGKMYAGQIITYKVSPLSGIKLNWATEITHIVDQSYFVDEQRFGPYAFWQHKHWFEEVAGGVKMTDIVHYAIPWYGLGDMGNRLIVLPKLEEIFSYRKEAVEKKFG